MIHQVIGGLVILGLIGLAGILLMISEGPKEEE